MEMKRKLLIGTLIALPTGILIALGGGLWHISRTFMYSPPRVFIGATATSDATNHWWFGHTITQATLGRISDLPAHASNVFVCNDNRRDPAFWLAFDLPESEVQSFITGSLRLDLPDFVDGILSAHSSINSGPMNRNGPLDAGQWNIGSLTSGMHYEEFGWFTGIDTNRHRVFICHWTM
jgi:hypothetical protein